MVLYKRVLKLIFNENKHVTKRNRSNKFELYHSVKEERDISNFSIKNTFITGKLQLQKIQTQKYNTTVITRLHFTY